MSCNKPFVETEKFIGDTEQAQVSHYAQGAALDDIRRWVLRG